MVRIGLLCLILSGLGGCKINTTAWEDTCLLYDTYEELAGRPTGACENIEEPGVIYESMTKGMQGYYDGDDTIHVNEDLRGYDKESTIVHEMVHYLDKMWLGLEVPGRALFICQSEDKAWMITGVWWSTHGHREKANPTWWKSYPYCWEWYAPAVFELTLQEYIDVMGTGDDIVIVEMP